MFKRHFFHVLLCYLLPALVSAQAGAIDPTFANDGSATTSFLSGGHASPGDVAVLPNGRILVVGDTWQPTENTSGKIAMIRYMPNGSIDETFGSSGKKMYGLPNHYVSAYRLLLLPDGKFLCCGYAADNTQEYFMLARFNADGSPDLTFDADGIVLKQASPYSQSGTAVAVQSDGKILLGGYANLTGYLEPVVWRFHSNGSVDNSFGGGAGFVHTPLGDSYAGVEEIMIQPDGRIVAACHATINGLEKFAALRYLPNGNLDNSFSGDGKAIFSITNAEDFPSSAVLQPDGKIVIGGYCQAQAANSAMAALRLLPNGNLDAGFGDNGIRIVQVGSGHEQGNDLLLQPDGKLLIVGSAQVSNVYHSALARLLPNGQIDAGFGQNGSIIHYFNSTGDNIQAVALQTDGRIVSAGSFWIDGRHHFSVCRFQNTVLTTGINDPSGDLATARIYPNPVGQQAILEIDAETGGPCSVDLYDLQGSLVQPLSANTLLPAGKARIALEFPATLPAGQYVVQIRTETGRRALPVVLVR